jgi:hypothetical protein
MRQVCAAIRTGQFDNSPRPCRFRNKTSSQSFVTPPKAIWAEWITKHNPTSTLGLGGSSKGLARRASPFPFVRPGGRTFFSVQSPNTPRGAQTPPGPKAASFASAFVRTVFAVGVTRAYSRPSCRSHPCSIAFFASLDTVPLLMPKDRRHRRSFFTYDPTEGGTRLNESR